MSYREITAKRVTPILFLSLIGLKTCYILVSNTIYWQKRLNWAFLMHELPKNFYIKENLKN